MTWWPGIFAAAIVSSLRHSFQGTVIAGLPAGLTAYGGTQLADRYRAVVVGAGRNLGDWGAVSVDVTHARSQLADDSTHQGQSLRFLYAKSLNNYGTNFQLLGYRYSTRGFYTWMMWHIAVWKGTTTNTIATDAAIKCRWRRATTISATAKRPLSGQYFAKSGGLRVTVSFRQSTKLLEYGGYQYRYQLGYASGWQGISYSLSWSWSESVGSSGADRILAFNMSVPFSVLTGRRYARDTILDRTYATFNANRNRDGDNSWQTGVGGTLLEGRNLSYSVTQGRSSSNGYSGSASASWQATYGTLGVGYNYDRDQHDYNWQLSGGVVGHADGITFSQPLGDTNVLIKAPGAKACASKTRPA